MNVGELKVILETYPDNMEIALRAKDDFLLTKDKIYEIEDLAYFGNCSEGTQFENKLKKEGKRIFNKDTYEHGPKIPMLIFDTFKV